MSSRVSSILSFQIFIDLISPKPQFPPTFCTAEVRVLRKCFIFCLEFFHTLKPWPGLDLVTELDVTCGSRCPSASPSPFQGINSTWRSLELSAIDGDNSSAFALLASDPDYFNNRQQEPLSRSISSLSSPSSLSPSYWLLTVSSLIWSSWHSSWDVWSLGWWAGDWTVDTRHVIILTEEKDDSFYL